MRNEIYGRIIQERDVIKVTAEKIYKDIDLKTLKETAKTSKASEEFLKGDFLPSEKDIMLAQKIIEKIREKGDEVREYSFRLYLKGGTDKNKKEAIDMFHAIMRTLSKVFSKAKFKKPNVSIEMLTYYPKLEPEIERELIFTTSKYESEIAPTQIQRLIMKETDKSLSQPFLTITKNE